MTNGNELTAPSKAFVKDVAHHLETDKRFEVTLRNAAARVEKGEVILHQSFTAQDYLCIGQAFPTGTRLHANVSGLLTIDGKIPVTLTVNLSDMANGADYPVKLEVYPFGSFHFRSFVELRAQISSAGTLYDLSEKIKDLIRDCLRDVKAPYIRH